MRLQIPDPFRPGHYFDVDPVKIIARCTTIYEATEWPLEHGGTRPHEPKNHAACPHCPRLRALAGLALDVQHASLEFSQTAKPGGIDDTQPIEVAEFALVEKE